MNLGSELQVQQCRGAFSQEVAVVARPRQVLRCGKGFGVLFPVPLGTGFYAAEDVIPDEVATNVLVWDCVKGAGGHSPFRGLGQWGCRSRGCLDFSPIHDAQLGGQSLRMRWWVPQMLLPGGWGEDPGCPRCWELGAL